MTLLHATAVKIRTNETGSLAEEIEARTPTGRRVLVRARAFVLCCGGIENARLLLASDETETNGVGNRHDLVGRFFQDHPACRCATIATDAPGPLQHVFGVFRRNGVRYYPKLRLSERAQEADGLVQCGGNVGYEFPDDSGAEAALRLARSLRARRLSARVWRDLRYVLRDLPGAARFVRQYVRGRSHTEPPQEVYLLGICEQAPNPDSRITLAHERDALGVPCARLDWRVTDLERRAMEAFVRAVEVEFARLGLGRVQAEQWLTDRGGGWTRYLSDTFHHIGTSGLSHFLDLLTDPSFP